MQVFHRAFYLSSYILPRNPQESSGPTNLWTETSLATLSAISFPRTPPCPGTQYSPSACRVEMSFNVFWHCSDLYVKKSCNNYSKNIMRHLSKILSTGRTCAQDLWTSVMADVRTCEVGGTLLDREMSHRNTSSKNVQLFLKATVSIFLSECQCDIDNAHWGTGSARRTINFRQHH